MICESLKTKTNNEGTIISELLKKRVCVCTFFFDDDDDDNDDYNNRWTIIDNKTLKKAITLKYCNFYESMII